MGIIYQHDKRSDITYAYESHAVWDKEKRMSRAKRTLIGRLDAETGEIVPTDGRCKPGRIKKEKTAETNDEILYEKTLKKLAAQETLITALKKELSNIKGANNP